MSRRPRHPLYAARVRETITWMLREMRVEGGAFAAALDAEQCEPRRGQVLRLDGLRRSRRCSAPTRPLVQGCTTMLHIGSATGKAKPSSTVSRSPLVSIGCDGARAGDLPVRSCLQEPARTASDRARDHKVLADWNGLAIAALTLAGVVFESRPELARRPPASAFDFVMDDAARQRRTARCTPGARGRAGARGDARRLRRAWPGPRSRCSRRRAASGRPRGRAPSGEPRRSTCSATSNT